MGLREQWPPFPRGGSDTVLRHQRTRRLEEPVEEVSIGLCTRGFPRVVLTHIADRLVLSLNALLRCYPHRHTQRVDHLVEEKYISNTFICRIVSKHTKSLKYSINVDV